MTPRDLIIGGVAAGMFLAHRLISEDAEYVDFPVLRAAEAAVDEGCDSSPSPLGFEFVSAQPAVTGMRELDGHSAAPPVEDKSEGRTETMAATAAPELGIVIDDEDLGNQSKLESLQV